MARFTSKSSSTVRAKGYLVFEKEGILNVCVLPLQAEALEEATKNVVQDVSETTLGEATEDLGKATSVDTVEKASKLVQVEAAILGTAKDGASKVVDGGKSAGVTAEETTTKDTTENVVQDVSEATLGETTEDLSKTTS
ncbi:hypothetical protein ASPWEDRAFT_169210, partial [Aspergillus wentii DTO 134E9]